MYTDRVLAEYPFITEALREREICITEGELIKRTRRIRMSCRFRELPGINIRAVLHYCGEIIFRHRIFQQCRVTE